MHRGGRASASPCSGLSPYARCHRACVVLTPSTGNAILLVLFPKEPVPALPPSPQAQAAGTTCSGTTMAVPLLTMMVLLVVFGAEVRRISLA